MKNVIDEKSKMNNNPNLLPPLTLAYIGDAVYELWVRKYLVSKGYTKVNDLHKHAVNYVKATTQSKFVEEMASKLTEEENAIIKRGRNAKSGHQPKNTEMIDYRRATGLEALVGYLYLLDRQERLEEIFDLLTQVVEK